MTRPVSVPPIDPSQINPPSREIYGLMGEANICSMMEDFYRASWSGLPCEPSFPRTWWRRRESRRRSSWASAAARRFTISATATP